MRSGLDVVRVMRDDEIISDHRRRLVSAFWLGLTAMSLTAPAYACPVCGLGRDGTSSAYLVTAVLMSLAPLTMFGAIAYYLFRQVKRDQAKR